MSTFLWKAVKVAALLTIGQVLFNIFREDSSKESGKPEEQHTPPVHKPEQHQPVYQLPPRPPPSQSYRPSSQRAPPPPEPPKYEDDDQTDRLDEYYSGLRTRANKEGDEMARCFSESHEAFDRGDHAAAKDLSNQGKNHKQKMEQLNKDASNWIYLENNRGREPGEIDLHGLYVKEAITRTDAALAKARLRGDSEIRLIVGKGSHSEGGVAKVRLAIEELMHKYQLVAELDPSNSGVLVVNLN
ncbi:cytoplasmic protein [Armillaria luteobubalina]|uniref:Cytoplasmic protein n=1 Tax=Armillaria luteobubalina TaxID=153913 RepID=A0AA39PLG5_9AGAR|nr:cytoplasmic protein [Armillaria luteobubalina]